MSGAVAITTILPITMACAGIGAPNLITVTSIYTTGTWQLIRSEKSHAVAERSGETREKLKEELHHCHRELDKAAHRALPG